VVQIAYADLYVKQLAGQAAIPAAVRREATQRALGLLARAEALNPLRSDAPYLQGMLYDVNKAVLDSNWPERARHYYLIALSRDPGDLEARIALVNLMRRVGDMEAAHSAAEAGLARYYPFTRMTLMYLTLCAELRAERGDQGGAEALARTADVALVSHGKRAMVLDALLKAHPEPGSVDSRR
jgi:hypothetical protein